MPNYYNPYNFYPASYVNSIQPSSYSATGVLPQQQSYAQQPQLKAMEWVEGEVGAKAFNMPNGWPANQPIPLWDSTDTVIWLKSWGPMGIPNPMQKLKYEMPQQQNYMLPQGQNEDNAQSGTAKQDMSQYVTKEDLNQMRNEIRNLLTQNNQNGRPIRDNRGEQNGKSSV